MLFDGGAEVAIGRYGRQILPGAEAAAGAGQQHRAAAVIGRGVVERGGQRAMQLVVERVEAGGAVQRERHPAVPSIDQQHCLHRSPTPRGARTHRMRLASYDSGIGLAHRADTGRAAGPYRPVSGVPS